MIEKSKLKQINIGSLIKDLLNLHTKKKKEIYPDRIIIGNNTYFYENEIIISIIRKCTKCETIFKIKNINNLWDWCEKCKLNYIPSFRPKPKYCQCGNKFKPQSKCNTRCPSCHEKEENTPITYKISTHNINFHSPLD